MFKEYRIPKINKYKDFKENNYFYHLLPWAYIYENKDFVIRIKDDKELKNFPIIITKDGSFQTTFKFRGKDLDSCTTYELLNMSYRVNDTLKQLNNEWTLHINAIRKRIKKYDKKTRITNYPIRIIELEREEFFKSGVHFESDYYITLTWQTPEDKLAKAKSLFFTKSDEKAIEETFINNLKYYNDELLKVYTFLNEVLNECEILSIDETLTYYHSLVSDANHPLKVPRAFYDKNKLIAVGQLPEKLKDLYKNNNNLRSEILPVLIDSYITDCTLTGGIEPKVGEDYIKTVSILNFPGDSIPGIFDSLNRTDIPYIWSTRYIMLEKIKAQKMMDDYYKLWFAARKSVKNLLGESFTKTESANQNYSALKKSQQVTVEKLRLEDNETTVGYYTTTIILKDKNKQVVEKYAQQVKTLINSLGFNAEVEGFYNLDTYLGSLPGNKYFNDRRPPMNSLVLSHLIPTNAVWAGDSWNKHLNEPPLIYCQTVGSTPFRLNLHYNDVGHTLIVGPSGAGKSVLLGDIQASFLGYKNAKVIGFDKGASTRALCKATDGIFYDLGNNDVRFQPLREIGKIQSNIDKKIEILKKQGKNITEETLKYLEKEEEIRAEKEREWCQQWLEGILEDNKINITTDIKEYIKVGLKSLAVPAIPIEMRTISSFVDLVGGQSQEIKKALSQYCKDGIYAKYFDGNSEFLEESHYTIFEMEKIIESKNILSPTLEYLFHIIETKMIDKIHPALLTFDEVWILLSIPRFKKKIEEWLRVMRKNNVSVVFATQSLSDIANSDIRSVILDQCFSRIFLPNPSAISEIQSGYYKMFDLNDREIQIISQAAPQRQYYYKSPKGSRLFELALSPLELAYIATSSGKDQDKCKELSNLSYKDFNIEWLNYKGWDGKAIINGIEKIIENDKKGKN